MLPAAGRRVSVRMRVKHAPLLFPVRCLPHSRGPEIESSSRLAVDGFNEVDKLKKSIELHTRKLAGSPTAEEAAEQQPLQMEE